MKIVLRSIPSLLGTRFWNLLNPTEAEGIERGRKGRRKRSGGVIRLRREADSTASVRGSPVFEFGQIQRATSPRIITLILMEIAIIWRLDASTGILDGMF